MVVRKISDPQLENYLRELDSSLKKLSKDERDMQVSEIKDHLYVEIQNKINEGNNVNEAVRITLENFVPPKKLAEDLTSHDSKNEFSDVGNSYFTYGVMLLVGSIGGLSVPILKSEIDLGIVIPFLFAMVIGYFLLQSKKIQWNEVQLKNLKWIGKIIIGLIALPLTFFFINLNRSNNIDYFILGYLVFILCLTLIVYRIIKHLYDSNY
ncbi:HAAS signaling domain-containing protein [Cytobacillus purgationiresistens]|uniref:Membrane protein n=1 Tax=Cytobacillus purgationiresistens TaxID=863449 RepID=A0ABU0ANT7_9BACI|nr:hypothetical protein [Cytobacillus purgationiresistens]MDQ0272954.1 putative membrane protein [Cytobacillus purgationiresistens]